MLFGGKAVFDNLICHLYLPTSSESHLELRQRGYGIWVLTEQDESLSLTFNVQGSR